MMGARNPSTTRRILFGDKSVVGDDVLPSKLDHFVRATSGEYGTIDDILINRTVLPFYLPTLPQATTNRVFLELRSGRGGWARNAAITDRKRVRRLLHLRFCEVCLDEIGDTGPIYWRVAHQFPTTLFCQQHECKLEVQPLDFQSNHTARWVLPDRTSTLPGKHIFSDRDSQLCRLLSAETLPWTRAAPSCLSDRKSLHRLFRSYGSTWSGEHLGFGAGDSELIKAFFHALWLLSFGDSSERQPVPTLPQQWSYVFRNDRPIVAAHILILAVLVFGSINELVSRLASGEPT